MQFKIQNFHLNDWLIAVASKVHKKEFTSDHKSLERELMLEKVCLL